MGTPRLIAERTGQLEGVKRNDYLPFGEAIQVGVGGRSNAQGYVSESVRQGFTGYEEDAETGLDYAQARYFSSPQGRFTAVDPLMASANPANPQTWNRYSYALNNPTRFTDPTGLITESEYDGTEEKLIPLRKMEEKTKQLAAEEESRQAEIEAISQQDKQQDSPPCKPQVVTLGNGEQKPVRPEGCGNGPLITANVIVEAGPSEASLIEPGSIVLAGPMELTMRPLLGVVGEGWFTTQVGTFDFGLESVGIDPISGGRACVYSSCMPNDFATAHIELGSPLNPIPCNPGLSITFARHKLWFLTFSLERVAEVPLPINPCPLPTNIAPWGIRPK